MLHGLRLFGSENNNYTITIVMKDTENMLGSPALSMKTGTFFSEVLKFKYGDFHGFEVWFDSPAYLKKNTGYRVEASISGPQSFKGAGGMSAVRSSGVTFKFKTSAYATNETNHSVGQFPEFLFSEIDQ